MRRAIPVLLAWATCLTLILPDQRVMAAQPKAEPRARRATTQAATASAAGVTRVRIGVTTDGIVRITPADLTGLGLNLASIDPRTFALSSLGQPIAIDVTGEADGRFETANGDVLLFLGQRFRGAQMDEKYTDERVYWLEIGGTSGPRMTTVDATPLGDLTPPSDFLSTTHAEENRTWWPHDCIRCLDTRDTWFWDRLTPFGAGATVTRTFPYRVSDPAPGYTATLRLEQAASAGGQTHSTTIALNGTDLGTFAWTGHVSRVFSTTAPANLLTNGTNTVSVGASNSAAPLLYADASQPPPVRSPASRWRDALYAPELVIPDGATFDDVYVNYWEIDYRRLFRAWQGQLDFTVAADGPNEFLTRNWATAQVTAWDVTNPLLPRRLTGLTSQPEGSTFMLRMRSNAATGSRFWMQELASAQPAATLRLRPDTGLRNPPGGADAVIVMPASLRLAAETLAAWHRNHGRRAVVADFADVVDEFNDGIYHPKAISAMLVWAQTGWLGPGPQYLTLVGDGHWNFKGYNPSVYPPAPNLIPPYLAFVDPHGGEVPADAFFGDITGDGVPEIAVGRLAVRTLDEANAVVSKIVSYNENARLQAWQRQAVFVADNADGGGDFPALSDEIIAGYLPHDLVAQRIYLGVTVPDTASARAAIASAINAGAFMLQYTGHGSAQLWASPSIWRTSDVSTLTNRTQLPVVLTFNCLDGHFALPTVDGLAETMLRHPNGGVVAAVSPSGFGLAAEEQALRRILMRVMFDDQVRELGLALTIAKQRYAAQHQGDWAFVLVATQMLHGDPAMRLPAPAAATIYLPLSQRAQ